MQEGLAGEEVALYCRNELLLPLVAKLVEDVEERNEVLQALEKQRKTWGGKRRRTNERESVWKPLLPKKPAISARLDDVFDA